MRRAGNIVRTVSEASDPALSTIEKYARAVGALVDIRVRTKR